MKQKLWFPIISLFFLAWLGIAPAFQPARAGWPFDPIPTNLGDAVQTAEGEKAPTYSGCGGQIAPVVNASYEQEVLDLVNQVRADNGLPPLKLTPELVSSARYHATDMGQDNYFSHDSQDKIGGSLVVVCSWSTRIASFYTNANSLAENIAAGYATPESVMDGWMNSSGHKSNILSSSSREIGIGYYQGSGNYFRYWVQNFGRRSTVYPLIINSDQASTGDSSVILYIYGAGTWNEMRLRNDEGEWGDWQPFQSTIPWELTGPIGEHTVWAELKNDSQTITTSDSIYLSVNAAVPTLGNIPQTAAFTFSIPDNALYPESLILKPQNTGTGDPLSWTVSSNGNWFDVTPSSGLTPGTITITPSSFITETVSTYTGSITLTVTDPPGTVNSPHPITLTLNVVDYSPQFLFLPVIIK